MKNNWLILSLMVFGLVFIPNSAYAEEQTSPQTNSVAFSLSNTQTQLNVSDSVSFLSTIEIDSYEALKDFTFKFNTLRGASNISAYVNGNYCSSQLAGTITYGIYKCTTQLTSNLTSSTLNITITNEGYAPSLLPNVTINIIEGTFTIDSNYTFDVSNLTQADLDQAVSDINSFTNSTGNSILANIFNRVWQTISSLWSGRTGEEMLRDIENQTSNIQAGNFTCNNCSTNATEVWDVIYNSSRTNKTQGTLLIDDWKARFMSAIY